MTQHEFTHFEALEEALRPQNPFQSESDDLSIVQKWTKFQLWAEQHATFPCEGVKKGEVYQKETVEGPIWQVDYPDGFYPGEYRDVLLNELENLQALNRKTIQIYRLKPEAKKTPQLIETCKSCGCFVFDADCRKCANCGLDRISPILVTQPEETADYPVEAYLHENGETYGRYVNPHDRRIKNGEFIRVESQFIEAGSFERAVAISNPAYYNFETFAESNKFPFPGAEIGRVYQKEEVEGPIWQCELATNEWGDLLSDNELKICIAKGTNTRQIYRLKKQAKEEVCDYFYCNGERESHTQPKETAEQHAEVAKAMKYFTFSDIPEVNEFFQSLGGIYHDPNYQKIVEDFYNWKVNQVKLSKSEETAEQAADDILSKKRIYETTTDLLNLDDDFALLSYDEALEAMLELLEWQKKQEGKK